MLGAQGGSAKTRAGDFVVVAAAGLAAIVSCLTFGGATAAVTILVGILFGAVALMRYVALRDAPMVGVGYSVAEEQLESLGRMQALVAALPQPVMLLDEDGVIVIANPAAAVQFGGDRTGAHISHVERSPLALETLATARRTDAPQEVEIVSKGTPERVNLFFAAPVRVPGPSGGEGTLVMLRDRTEQRRLERMRTDFVANASHELRTPLTSLAGFIETLQGHARDDPEAQERFYEIMAAQTDRMLQLVEDLIGLSAIELNENRPPSEAVDLVSLAKSVCEAMTPVAQKQGAVMTCDFADARMTVRGDRHELFRVLQNLVDNAMKYGAPASGGRARVTIRCGRGAPNAPADALRHGETPQQVAVRLGIGVEDIIFFQVCDAGDGIDRGDLPRLTERFYRVNPQLSRAKGGTGLGLAIVKHIVHRHRGGLQVESCEGDGATFTCFLPPADAIPA